MKRQHDDDEGATRESIKKTQNLILGKQPVPRQLHKLAAVKQEERTSGTQPETAAAV